MRKQLFVVLFFGLLSFANAFAQKQIKGKVKEASGKPIEGVTITLKDKEENILNYARTNEKGEFTIAFSSTTNNLILNATSIGYEKKIVEVTALNQSYDLVLTPSATMLKTVVVKNRPQLVLKGDTLDYKTSDFADKQDRSIGDVLRKMPGIEVEESGKIKYNGKAISNFYIDGDNLLDDKYNIGSKSIPHGAVDKVQVIEKDQPIKMLRKNNMSDDVALNLVIKDEARLKLMGDAKIGLGTPNRFDGNLTGMMFKKNLKFINNIKGNNIGIDPGLDLTSHNFTDYLKRLENNKPNSMLSTGAAGVPLLPESRYLFNKAGVINLNNLYKLNKDLQLKANISYLYDRRIQQYNKFSETYLPGQTITYTELQDNRINPQQLHSQFNLNSNQDAYYLNNTLVVDYIPFSTTSAVNINNIGANQVLKQETFNASNEFSYRKKLKSGIMLNYYSFVNYTTQPENLNITPGLNENILNNGKPYAGLTQQIKLPTAYTNNYFSFALVKNSFVQTYKTGFNLQQQQLNTNLYRTQNNQTVEPVNGQTINNLNWFKTKFYTDATYAYDTDKIKTSVELPLSFNQINYKDPVNNINKNLERLFLNPKLSFKYQTGIENYVTAFYNFKNDLGAIDDVFQGTILRNYRSLFTNNAPITESKAHILGTGFNYRKAIQMFFLSFTANYSKTTFNTISAYTLTNNIQQRVVLPLNNEQENLTLAANTSKYLFNLKSTISAGISHSNTKYNQLQNNQLLPFEVKTTTYKAAIDAKLTSFINCSYSANYSVTNNQALTISTLKSNFKQLRQQGTLAITTFNNVYLNLTAEHLFTQQNTQPDLKYLFADFNIKYKLLKYKTDLEFGITNLANIQSFEAINLSANSLTTGTYFIPGRVAMLKAVFNF